MTLKIKDPGSALTHFIAMILALCAASPLLIKAAQEPGSSHVLALTVFITSMILLYAASTIYHTLDISPKINRMLRKADHMMIFILIAGTYTPVCMLVLGDRTGWLLLALVWGIAAVGILINVMLTGEHPSKKLAEGKMGRIVDRCTHVNPQRRYKNVLRLMEAL